MTARSFGWLIVAVALCAAPQLQAAPTSLTIHGALRTASGSPVPDGDYLLAVGLYETLKGGTPLFWEKLAVKVRHGGFAAVVGIDDPTKKLDHSLFVSDKARFVGVRVGTEAELPRVAIRPVPSASTAWTARSLACSGCVAAAHIGTGVVQSKHVQFNWAAGTTKGGAAKHALTADNAKKADIAAVADKANAAKSADNAKTAGSAAAVKCTGCIGVAHVSTSFVADQVKAGKLASVAVTGKFANLSGPLGADLDFNLTEAKLFRFQNAAKDPANCDKSSVGLTYYDTTTQTLKVCNGTKFQVFAKAAPIGSATQPGASCKDILAKEPNSASGLYYVTVGGTSTRVHCDMKVAGGGWLLLAIVSSSDGHTWTHASGNWENASTFGVADPSKDADFKGAAFSKFPISEVRVDFQGKFLLRTGACVGGKPLAKRFSSLSWSCGGSANLTSHPSCTNNCTVAEVSATSGDKVLTEGKSVSRLYFKTGEANGAQDTNKDRAYVSTSARNQVDEPFGLGSFCSGSSCAIKGDIDMGVRNDGAKFPGKGLRYAIYGR